MFDIVSRAVLFHLDAESRLALLEAMLCASSAPSRDLIDDVVDACGRYRFGGAAGRSLGRLLAAGAWTEAALALAAALLPEWQVRRLVHDGGEWVCTLSRQPGLPEDLDDAVDARHEELPLAILLACIDARRRPAEMRLAPARPTRMPPGLQPMCCENFG